MALPSADRKQRKRKLSDSQQSAAVADPDEHHKRKLELLAQDDQNEEMADADTAADAAAADIVEQHEEELVTGKSFNMKKFREKLREGEFIFELRHFLQTAATNPKVVGQYLKVGGKPLELIQSLERIDKTQLFHITYVFSALQLTLIEILSESTQLTQPAVQACSYLLNSHRTCVEKLLYSNVAQHKRVALKLLTAIVTLEPQFGRDILTTLSVVFNAENLEKFTRHSKYQIVDSDSAASNPDPVTSVRTCYIHFILAYLIEGNAMLVRNLLDRNELVMAVVSGLVYDDADTVGLVLGTLQRFVLKTAQVSKTKKVQVFNVPVVRHLLHLYEWRGPRYFAASLNRKQADRAGEQVDPDELAAVQKAVHEFLVVLLASRKHGIAFQCLGHRRTKANSTQKRVLGDLARPWQQPLKADLTVEMLRACPELARSYIKLVVAPALDMKNKHGDWAQAADYMCRLTDRLDAGILRVGAADMSALEMGQTIKALCMSPEVLQQMRSRLTLRSEQLRIRHQSTVLLVAMFRQCTRHLHAIGVWSVYAPNEMRKIRFNLFNHVFVMSPSVENILLSLHQTLHGDALSEVETDAALAMEHLEAVLDLLLIISAAMPAFIEQTASVINYIKILRPIYELNRERASSTRMELKAVRLILALEPKALSLRTEFFQQVMHSVLNVWRLGSAEERTEAKRLLRGVFANTGLFENGALEVDLWLEAFGTVDADEFESVRAAFVEALLSSETAEAVQPDDTGAETLGKKSPGTKTITALFRNIEQGISLDGHIDVPVLGKFFTHLAATFDVDDEHVLRFVETIGLALFHYLPEPHGVLAALGARHEHKYAKYMQSWMGKRRSGKLPAYDVDAVNRLYAALVSDEPAGDLSVVLGDADADMWKNETDCMQLLYVTVFVLIQRAEAEQLTAEHCTKSLEICKHVLGALQRQSATGEELWSAAAVGADGKPSAHNDSAYTKALRYLFCSRFQLLNNFSVWQQRNELTRFVFELMRHIHAGQQLATAAPAPAALSAEVLTELTTHFRMKLTNQIEYAVTQPGKNDEPDADTDRLLEMLTVFGVEHTHCETILLSLVGQPVDRFCGTDNRRSVYAALLAFALKRVADVRTKALGGETVASIARIYIGLLQATSQQVAEPPSNELLEDALYAYLTTFYHNIGDVPAEELLAVVFAGKRLSKSTVRLCTLLVERNAALLPHLVQDILPAHVGRKELIYPLLNVVCRRSTFQLDAPLLASVYAEFRNGILKTIEKPQKASVIYKENVYASLWLIERSMPLNECVDFCKRALKCDAAEVYQLQIIKAIHLKALHSEKVDVRRQVFESFVNTAVQLFNMLLKKDEQLTDGDYEKLQQFSAIVADWFKLQPERAAGATFDKITKSQAWSQFGKACLKSGMQKEGGDKSAVLLKLLAVLCDRFYADAAKPEECARLFEMVLSHSAFFTIALTVVATETKTNLMHLLFVLAKKNPSPLFGTHVPIFLGAYQAKLAPCDRYVLAILQSYEQAGIDMHPYKPFIWGDSAVAHYAIRGVDTEAAKAATLHQEPPIMQVMSMVDRETAEQTLAQFPIWRKLNAIEQVPEPSFTCYGIPGNEHLDLPRNAANRLEETVDDVRPREHDPELELLATRRDTSYADLYDPAFFVPLMSMSFAPEAYVRSVRPAQNGLLAMTFATLSSQDKEMRVAGANALQRYRTHLQTARFADNQVWAHLFECVQRGLGELTTAARRQKKSRVPRVPFVAGNFLGRTINTLINPLSELYRPLSTFLLFQKAYNFLAVPEFNVLFNSADANHVAHRHFMLEVLRDGIKCGSDFTILMGGNIFKALLGFYGTPMATRDTNLLILTVLNQALRIPRSAKVLVDQVGVLPWLGAAIDAVEFFQFDVIDGLCSMLSNLYYAVRYLRKEYANGGEQVQLRLFGLVAKLCPKLSTRTGRASLAKYVNVLGGVAAAGYVRFLSEANVEHLIKCARAHCKGEDLAFVRDNDGRYAESRYGYVRRLRAAGGEEQLVFIEATLREVIVQWRRTRESVE